MEKVLLLLLLYSFLFQFISAQSPQTLAIREYVNQHANNIINEFTSFISLPNVAKDTVNIQKNASFILDMMNKRGIKNVQLLTASTAGVPPAVYGEVNVAGAKQ